MLADLGTAFPLLALAATSFVLGARHGLDGDHIAAITDLTSPRPGDEERPARDSRRGVGRARARARCVRRPGAAARHRPAGRPGPGLASLTLGALILTGYSDVVPPLVPER